ncbi:MAG: hypothetical protein ACI8WM_002048 [Burkholderiaceae bacterium]|jgi:hypothetical protein
MFLDHPTITATSASTEPDRIERLNRVYGYVVGLADYFQNPEFITKIWQIHDHKGTLLVIWLVQPSDAEKGYFEKAWASKLGDSSNSVEHEMKGVKA